jgi:CheY-like chemotaxis protein
VHLSSGIRGAALLHIDDVENDRILVREAIAQSRTPFEYHAADGVEAGMSYLDFGEEYPPAMVLLDYNLGTHTGADFLYWLRELKQMTSIPVVMLSGSPGNCHVQECYAAGANHFITKAVDFHRLQVIVRTLHLSLVSDLSGPDLILELAEYRPDPVKEKPAQKSSLAVARVYGAARHSR